MARNLVAVVTGIVVWVALVTVGGLALRYGWPAYPAAEPQMSFDLSMKIARLALSSVALVTGALAVWRVKPSRTVELIFGVVMLVIFIPIHYNLWPRFPVWYHLTFLTSLIVLPLLIAIAAPKPVPENSGT